MARYGVMGVVSNSTNTGQTRSQPVMFYAATNPHRNPFCKSVPSPGFCVLERRAVRYYAGCLKFF
jgi:hypothetical protein